MKILQINAVNKISSTGRNCTELSEYLNMQGDVCYTAFSVGETDEKSQCISTVPECKFHAVMSRITGMQGYYSPIGTRKLISLMDEFKPDIVHLNNLHANYLSLNLLLPYIAEQNIATVVTLHDCWCYTGKCTHYSVLGCNKWQTGCHDCEKLKDDHNSWVFDRTDVMWKDKKNWFNSIPNLGVIGVSKWITNEARKSPVFEKAKQIECIYNWIDLEMFKPQSNREQLRTEYGLNKKRILLGVANRWGESKGLNAFLSLADYLPEDMRIVLLGKIPQMELPEKIMSIPSTDNVRKLVEIYNMADVFVQLSREESFGKVTAEALACGVPVVTNSGTANPELIDETCGMIAGDSPEETAKAVGVILDKGKAFYSSSCRSFAEKNFSKEANLTEYRDFYTRMLN